MSSISFLELAKMSKQHVDNGFRVLLLITKVHDGIPSMDSLAHVLLPWVAMVEWVNVCHQVGLTRNGETYVKFPQICSSI